MKNIAGRVGSQRRGNNLTHTYREHQRDIPPQQLAENAESAISQSPLPDSLVHAKVIAFELQCPACVRIWRSAAPCILNDCYLLTVDLCSLDAEEGHYLLANVPALQPYFATKCQRPPLRRILIARRYVMLFNILIEPFVTRSSRFRHGK
ncbi:hypothetical protein JVT61DRAFT_10205 [Boletus reticuloceps]|uniref:Uncharacterized protein n=1 Tax=Boletus reticuloceps TaxID=495285 RepID=A0A8I3ADR3_9AGAM|nr:hypothetical protein JVT61DRAFT_10205 [Boletus reticuloceps]